MTKALLERERAKLKATVAHAYQIATAYRRRGSAEPKELILDLDAIASLSFASIAASKPVEGPEEK